jgi:hypothetical protein
MVHAANLVLSAVCGFLFAAAWWLFVDGTALADRKGHGSGPAWIYPPGILATLGLFLISNLPTTMFQKGSSEESLWWQKGILLVSVMCKCAGIIVAIWLYVINAEKGDGDNGYVQYRGIATIVQTVLISITSFAWNFLYQDPNSY